MRYIDMPQNVCRFGIARCDITPPIGIYHRMWGAATHDRSTGVHRPLLGTALVFQGAEESPLTPSPSPRTDAGSRQEVILLAIDHCLLWANDMALFLTTVSQKAGVAREQLLVSFSHSHASGLMDRSRAHLPGGDLIGPYLDEMAARLAALVKQARSTVQPATITYTYGRCSLAAHRDFYDEKTRQFVCGYNPAGPSDDTVLVGRATGNDGRLLATLVNYACHPTTLAWKNTLISPDYPGAMREVVERETSAPCVFLQGASGDLGPRDDYVGDPAIADRNGRQLGYAALSAFETLPPPGTRFQYMGPVVSGATLGDWAHVQLDAASLQAKRRWRLRRWTIPIPYRADLPKRETTLADRARWQADEDAAQGGGDKAKARDCHAMVERMDRQLTRIAEWPSGADFPFPITLLQMGDAFWLAVEAEHYQHLQVRLRERFPGIAIMVLTLINGSRPAYLPSRDSYGKGIYQESIAVLAPGCLEQVTEAAATEIAEWLM